MIELKQITHQFNQHQVLHDISFNIGKGEILGLAGHNGAGKSTLFKIMLGLLKASQGQVFINGCANTDKRFIEVRRQLGYLPENVMLYDNLTGLETLEFFARMKSLKVAECMPLLEKLGLAAAAKRPVRDYSKGMRQRLGFAQALLGRPQVLFLDEPTNGLDPMAIRDFYLQLNELARQGVSIVISSHILAELQQRVHRLAILNQGGLQAIGSVMELRKAANLPLTCRLKLTLSGERMLANLLESCNGIQAQFSPEYCYLHCAGRDKHELLRLLQQLASDLIDFEISEASLEQVFVDMNRPREQTTCSL